MQIEFVEFEISAVDFLQLLHTLNGYSKLFSLLSFYSFSYTFNHLFNI